MSFFLHRPRLPYEIWSLIFGAISTSPLYDLPLLTQSSPLHTLRLVCKEWEHIILSTPTLWSRLTILVGGPSPSSLSAMHCWVKRSENAHLYIDIGVAKDCDEPALEVAQRIDNFMLSLVPYQSRLKRLHVYGPWTTPTLLQASTGTLMDLSVCSRGLSGRSEVSSILALPLKNLRSLRLEVHADQLLTLDKCAIILSMAPRIEHCYIDVSHVAAAPIHDFTCPTLRSLHLLVRGDSRYGSDCDLASFFGAMRDTPLLEELSIDWLAHGSFNLGDLPSALARFSPSLRCLRLSYLPAGDSMLSDCLAALKYLDSVCLRYPLAGLNDPITGTLLRRLTYQYIHLECTGEQFSGDDVIAMLGQVGSCYLSTARRKAGVWDKLHGSFQWDYIYA